MASFVPALKMQFFRLDGSEIHQSQGNNVLTARWRTPIASQYWENSPPPMNCNARVERSLRSTMGKPVPDNGRFLRHRFSLKPTSVATPNSLPKRNHVAKEAVSAAWQTTTRQRNQQHSKPNDAPKTKPRPCVKTMLADNQSTVSTAETGVGTHEKAQQPRTQDFVSMMQENL